jgi:hypothetical protein
MDAAKHGRSAAGMKIIFQTIDSGLADDSAQCRIFEPTNILTTVTIAQAK